MVFGVTDCPHWFVGDTEPRKHLRRHIRQTLRKLRIEHRLGLLRFTLFQRLAHTKNGIQTSSKCTLHLPINKFVGLIQFVSTLAVPQDDVLAIKIEKHRWAHFACVRTLGLWIHILRAQCDLAAPQHVSNEREIWEWRTEDGNNLIVVGKTIDYTSRQLICFRGGRMHLPIADNELLTNLRFHLALPA